MILVFVDFMNSDEEIPIYKEYLKKLSIAAKVTDNPEDFMRPSAYTHVFLDYGGLDLPGNSLFSSLNSQVRNLVENNPSIEFVIISVMGEYGFEHILDFNASNLHCMRNFRDKDELLKILTLSGE